MIGVRGLERPSTSCDLVAADRLGADSAGALLCRLFPRCLAVFRQGFPFDGRQLAAVRPQQGQRPIQAAEAPSGSIWRNPCRRSALPRGHGSNIFATGGPCPMPLWLDIVSIAFLLLGFVCAGVVAVDVMKRPQPMWIMNIVWPVTGTLRNAAADLVLLALRPRRAGGRAGRRARRPWRQEAVSRGGRHRRHPLRRRLHAGRHRGGVAGVLRAGGRRLVRLAQPVRRQDVRGVDRRLHLRLRLRHRLPVLRHRAHARAVARRGHRRRAEGRYAVADRMAGGHVRLHGLRPLLPVPATCSACSSRSTRRSSGSSCRSPCSPASAPAIRSTGGSSAAASRSACSRRGEPCGRNQGALAGVFLPCSTTNGEIP